jgi:hypothetical protein
MSHEIKKTTDFIVTPKIAAAHLALTPVGVDCKLKPKKMADLRKHILNKSFHSSEWGIIKCKEDGGTHRVNGKTTSTLFSDPRVWAEYLEKYGEDIKVKIVCTTWECDTLREMSKIFATYDRKITVRSPSDNNKAAASYVVSLATASKTTIDKCVSGIATAQLGHMYHLHRSAEERAQELFNHDEYCAFIREHYESKEVDSSIREKFRQYGIFGAMWLCFNEDKKAARIFWGLVFKGEGPAKSRARKLHTHIITKPLTVLRGNSSNERTESRLQECLRQFDKWSQEEGYKDYPLARRKKILAKRTQLREARITQVAKKDV